MKTRVCAVLTRGRKMLLGKQSPLRESYANVWDLIGGHCESWESTDQVETGIACSPSSTSRDDTGGT